MRLVLRSLAAIVLAASPAPRLMAQSSSVTTFIVVQDKDTVSLEQFTRVGNTITGVWIAYQNKQLQVHDFVLTLGAGGMPTHYDMAVAFPDGAGNIAPSEAKYVMDFGPDSVTLVTGRNRLVTQHIAMQGAAFPTYGNTLHGQDLSLAALRAAHLDSGAVAFTTLGAARATPPFLLSMKFVGPDSAIVGTAHVKVDKEGHLLGWRTREGGEGRRVAPIDVKKFVDGLVAADLAAEASARAAHPLATLSAAALDQLAGEYALNPTTRITIARDNDKLTMRVANQPPIDLLAQSATTFFVQRVTSGRIIEFETDAAGNATALLLQQPGGQKQRIAKVSK